MSPRDMRLLKSLVERRRVYVNELRLEIGSLNPAQNALSLRKQGWKIQTDYINMRDRDGRICHPGYYWIDDSEKRRARAFIEEAERAAATAHPADSDETASSETSNPHYTPGEEL